MNIRLCLVLIAFVLYTSRTIADVVSVTVTDVAVSDVIESGFASFSFEISGTLPYTGSVADSPKASFVQLLNNLHQSDAKGPNLRIGGNSADTSWWNPDGNPRPPNVTYDIKPFNLVSVVNVANLTKGSVVFDVSMKQPSDPIWAVNHVKAISTYVGFDLVRGVEIGNEPDVFYENGIRPSTYTYANYLSEWENYAKAVIGAGLPSKKIQGATFCTNSHDWVNGLPNIMKQYQSQLSSVSYHRYPLTHCGGHIDTLSQLLEDASTVNVRDFLKPLADDARALNLPLYVGEGNSISCGGYPGVSNVFGAALWAVDVLFNIASVNVRGWNFHGGATSSYTAISYASIDDPTPSVKPLYYGMWVFSDVTKYDAKIVQTSIQTTNPFIKVWAVKNSKEITTVVLIHKDLNSNQSASVSITPSSLNVSPAHLRVLQAPSVHSTGGITYGGLTFDGSSNGLPIGRPVVTPILPDDSGSYKFNLDPLSVAVLELP